MKKKAVISNANKEVVCPICKKRLKGNLGEHIRKLHGDEEFERAVLKAKESGMPDPEIGMIFNVTFKQIEKIITERYGVNISVLKRPKNIKYWAPKDFKEETTTVWSFKRRGDWATHDGRYRGNWSPYIPRNVILKYSKPGETVLDYFVGSGTTAVEVKLLGRKCIARDINPACIGLTLENLNFKVPEKPFKKEPYPTYEPDVSIGDARCLSDIGNNEIDLICAHPPYAGIISYSSKVEGDLSRLSIKEFLEEMRKVAHESYRVLKPGSKCAILIGDTRKKKHVIPIGFQTINVFLNEGFKLKELVIKRQHNCKTTGFWYEKSIKYNFLLLAHEYLPIFEKPKLSTSTVIKEEQASYGLVLSHIKKPSIKRKLNKFETTTVWIFPKAEIEEQLNKNVIERYANKNGYLISTFVAPYKNELFISRKNKNKFNLLFIKSPFLGYNPSKSDIECFLKEIKNVVQQKLSALNIGGFLAIQVRDVRMNGYIEPIGKKIVDLLTFNNLWLKEIVVVTEQEQKLKNMTEGNESLRIVHQYLLIYEVISEKSN